MFKISDTVIYSGSQLCIISDIREECFGKEKKLYYILKPVYDKNSTVYHPVEGGEAKIRIPITRVEADGILKNMSKNSLEWNGVDAIRREYFDTVLKEAAPEKLVALIRLISSKRTELLQNGKRLRAADEKAFNEARRSVSEELAFALDTDKDNIIDMILADD